MLIGFSQAWTLRTDINKKELFLRHMVTNTCDGFSQCNKHSNHEAALYIIGDWLSVKSRRDTGETSLQYLRLASKSSHTITSSWAKHCSSYFYHPVYNEGGLFKMLHWGVQGKQWNLPQQKHLHLVEADQQGTDHSQWSRTDFLSQSFAI